MVNESYERNEEQPVSLHEHGINIDFISGLSEIALQFFNQELACHERGEPLDQEWLANIYRAHQVTERLLISYMHGLETKRENQGLLPLLLVQTSEELESGMRYYLGGD